MVYPADNSGVLWEDEYNLDIEPTYGADRGRGHAAVARDDEDYDDSGEEYDFLSDVEDENYETFSTDGEDDNLVNPREIAIDFTLPQTITAICVIVNGLRDLFIVVIILY